MQQSSLAISPDRAFSRATAELSDSLSDFPPQQSDEEQPETRPQSVKLSDSQPDAVVQLSDKKGPRLKTIRTASLPSDEEILLMIGELDQQMRTDNYLPIFHLREKLQPPLSRDELDQALYRLERKDLIELSALQEVIAYTKEQIEAGIPQNVGGPLFFIIRCDRPSEAIANLSDFEDDITLQYYDKSQAEAIPQLATAEPEPEQTNVLHSAQESDKPAPEYRVGQGIIPKDFVEPGQEPQLPSGNRIVAIETADQLLAEIRWCLDNGGDFVFLYEPAHGHLPPRRAYYLRHPEWYWQGMRPVKTALVKLLIERRAIWTNDPAKGPGSGCRRFYPTESDSVAPQFPEWMTARQAFEALGGDPGDRNSSVCSADGSKQIKFSTFKSKTPSELKPFGLELNQDRKRRRQPCYRRPKPSS